MRRLLNMIWCVLVVIVWFCWPKEKPNGRR